MNRKDVITIASIVNAGLLIILLVGALTTKKSYFVASSAQVANTILKENKDGMCPKFEKSIIPTLDRNPILAVKKLEDKLCLKDEKKIEGIVHKLPLFPIKEKENFIQIVVKKGDSLEKIARNNSCTVNHIVEKNNLPNSFLKIGQLLLIPESKIIIKKQKINKTNYYTVKAGDNPWTISMKHHMKVEMLLKLNNLDNKKARKLRPGDKLKIR